MIDVFNKSSEYSHQNEFKIYVKRTSDIPLILNIGNLKDVAEIYPAKEFIDTFKATEKNNFFCHRFGEILT